MTTQRWNGKDMPVVGDVFEVKDYIDNVYKRATVLMVKGIYIFFEAPDTDFKCGTLAFNDRNVAMHMRVIGKPKDELHQEELEQIIRIVLGPRPKFNANLQIAEYFYEMGLRYEKVS